MNFYIAAFPVLGSHSSWIKEFRTQHDPVSSFVEPHMTLVFPTDALSEEALTAEVSQLIKNIKPFQVALRSAILMPEQGSAAAKHAHIFLVPDEGFSDVVRLHDRLYSGVLKSQLRLDIPFVPHLTIGAGVPLEQAKALTDLINSKPLEIEFALKALVIVKIEDPKSARRLSSPLTFG